MSSEIIPNVAYDNYDDFQHINFIVSHKCVSLFWGLFGGEIGLRVKYAIYSKAILNSSMCGPLESLSH
jgi:hypothetical protein